MNGKEQEESLEIRYCTLQAAAKRQRYTQIVPELESDHKEADTRMVLHAAYVSFTYEDIVISTPDTDVFMIALAKLGEIDANLFFLTGTKDKRRIVYLNALCRDVNERFNKTSLTSAVFIKALLIFHGFTGYDSVRIYQSMMFVMQCTARKLEEYHAMYLLHAGIH